MLPRSSRFAAATPRRVRPGTHSVAVGSLAGKAGRRFSHGPLAGALLALCCSAALPAGAADWPAWRGPGQDGASAETGLVETWSRETGEGLAWRHDFEGRSTPVVQDGRVCAAGRVGKEVTRQEIVACWDAASGDPLWERRFNVYLTTVPFNRVGWANPTFDPETGYLYHHGVGGLLTAMDPKDGRIVWQRELTQEVGHLTGYGGRTQTPQVFEDLLILSFVSSGWGDQAAPRHRYFAFDKKTGELIYVATPGTAFPYDMNTQGGQTIAKIGDQWLMIGGNSDGILYAMQARTGKKVWEFKASGNALNVTPVVDGNTVYMSHSEENVDEPSQGRVWAIDATGSGDVTKTHERWRVNELGAGFASPLVHDGRVYVVDNSANLFALEQATGKELWRFDLGTVGKGSPQWADGKIYASEVNGNFHVLRAEADGPVSLDREFIAMPNGRYAELYGSAAIADGRVYFTSEEGIYALGKKGSPAAGKSSRPDPKGWAPPAPAAGTLVQLQLVPADVVLAPGGSQSFRLRGYDANGNPVQVAAATLSLTGLDGTLTGETFAASASGGLQAGTITAKVGEVTAVARVRVIPPLPWKLDFAALEDGKFPTGWIGAAGKAETATLEGEKVLKKAPGARGLQRYDFFMGPSTWRDYTVQADFRGGADGPRMADIGMINNGYLFDVLGEHQKLRITDWAAMLRVKFEVPFAWQADVWYTAKFRVEHRGGKAWLGAKVWKRGEPEPSAWTVEGEDPLPIPSGTPGLCGYSFSTIFYDNFEVTPNP
jgi:outer membrane protein assembly factor BamB